MLMRALLLIFLFCFSVGYGTNPVNPYEATPASPFARPMKGDSAMRFRSAPLQQAIAEKRLDQVQRILRTGINPSARAPGGETPLEVAIDEAVTFHGAFSMIQTLVQAKTDVNAIGANGQTPLIQALSLGLTDVARLLIDAGASPDKQDREGNVPLMIAINKHQNAFIEEFLKKKAGLNAINKQGDTPLLLALKNNEPDEAGKLAVAGVEVNVIDSDGLSPLMIAAQKGLYSVVGVLALSGADVNISSPKTGRSPLDYAAESANKDLVDMFLSYGAAANADDNEGKRPLYYAIGTSSKNTDTVKLLLIQGAKVDFATATGETPLHRAAEIGNASIVELLIKNGAKMEAEDGQGHTALYIAAQHGNLDAVKKLVEKGAKVNGSSPPLGGAVLGGNERVIHYLIDNGAHL